MGTSDYDPMFDERVDFLWPELRLGKLTLAPVRVGMNAETGAIMVGWPHVVQSVGKIFATRFHERVLRRWVGSFIPHLLGESAVPHIIVRFWWALASALDLWEPNYHVKRVRVVSREEPGLVTRDEYEMTSPEELRQGKITFRQEGVYMPRGHLGDPTPERKRTIGLVERGGTLWARAPGEP